MEIEVKTLGCWIQTRNVLVENLGMNMTFQNSVDYSEDPSSDYQKTKIVIEEIFAKLRSHAVVGLKTVDASIKDSDLIKEIAAASAEAKKEADLIKNATKTVDKLAKAFDKVAGVVDKIAGLPFLS